MATDFTYLQDRKTIQCLLIEKKITKQHKFWNFRLQEGMKTNLVDVQQSPPKKNPQQQQQQQQQNNNNKTRAIMYIPLNVTTSTWVTNV